jgi:plastocyanin
VRHGHFSRNSFQHIIHSKHSVSLSFPFAVRVTFLFTALFILCNIGSVTFSVFRVFIMVSFTSLTLSSAVLAALFITGATAAPTPVSDVVAARTFPNRATHSVVVGRAGLHFDPENVVAEIGDVVEFHYLAANHSVVQSSFGAPCVPLTDDSKTEIGFFSGFMPTPAGQQNPNVFTIEVKDKLPIWYYCSQIKGDHCQSGMSGVINQNFDNGKTLAVYKETAAKQLGISQSVSPARVNTDLVGPNPNPLSGF